MKWAVANKRPNTVLCYRSHVNRLLESFKGKRLGQITPFLVEKHKRRRVVEGKTVAANRELTCLKTIFNRCIDWKKYEGENPVRKVKGIKESPGRLRFLSDDEVQRLVKAAREPLRTIILLGINTGLRIQSEALSLRWENVDLKRATLTVEAAYAKNRETREIPLNSVALQALKNLKRKYGKREYVFRGRYGKPLRSIRTAFTTACKNANLTGVTPHTLRHTFASRLAMAGVGDRTMQELGGWKEPKMLGRYAHLSEEHRKEAVEKIADHFTTLFTTPAEEETGKSLCARSSVG